ncbi:unnamed protein product [Cylicocyclus nassatus]|uniref:ARHGEF1-like PH domain-containing protein n=1 Tax=Cylicocyclus nassatus TaxID=53992 RepID=A0AA36H6N4_CYLNA|nr:unnamed protein product [Cylicocyclus nassatus]
MLKQQKTIKPEKEGGVEEKVKKTRFPSILVPPRRPSKIDATPGRVRSSQSSDGADNNIGVITSPPYSAPATQGPDSCFRDTDTGGTPFSAFPRLGDGVLPGEGQDASSSGPIFDFSVGALDHLQEEEPETDRMDPLSLGEVQSEDDQGAEVEPEQDPPHWQTLVSREVLALLTPQEIKRQQVINDDAEEKSKVKRAGECCRNILNHVNQEVKEAENKQNLDLTKRKMVHEGLLSWKVNKDKTIELYTLLLEDILVLMQRQDEKLILKCHSKNLAGTAETKHIFSPIIKLSTVMVRSVATDNKSFFVLSMSDNGAQIYELMAQTVSEQRTGVRDAVEMINSSVPKMNKDQDSLSTGSNQSPAGTNPFETKSEDEGEVESLLPVQDEEEVEAEEVDEEEVEAFLDSDLAYKLPFLKQGSRQAIAIEEKDSEVFDMPPLMADEALRNLAALRQLLINHMASQEEVDKGERGETRAHELRMGSLQGAADTAAPSGSVENGAEKTEMMQARPENAQELPSGDTGFFETSEEYGEKIV